MAERVPNSVGIRRLAERLIDTLTDCLTTCGLALNEKNGASKLELITAFYVGMRLIGDVKLLSRTPFSHGYDYGIGDIFIKKWACYWRITQW